MLTEIETVQKKATLIHTADEVDAAIVAMAAKINASELAKLDPIVLCVMNGGLVVTGKLLPLLDFPLTMDGINASRYGAEIAGTEITWKQLPTLNLRDKTVLIIDDILDEGLTLAAIYDYCQQQGVSAIFSAVLVDKQLSKPKPVKADFVGLSVANYYLYGSGMDYKGYCRNVAGIYACEQ